MPDHTSLEIKLLFIDLTNMREKLRETQQRLRDKQAEPRRRRALKPDHDQKQFFPTSPNLE